MWLQKWASKVTCRSPNGYEGNFNRNEPSSSRLSEMPVCFHTTQKLTIPLRSKLLPKVQGKTVPLALRISTGAADLRSCPPLRANASSETPSQQKQPSGLL